MKKIFRDIIIITFPTIIIMIITNFFYSFSLIKGTSMQPNFIEGDFVVYQKFNKIISRFDAVILKKGNTIYIKRVIGLPTEEIMYENNNLYINGENISEEFLDKFAYTENFNYVVSKGKYFVLGDNRENSLDSRSFGLVDYDEILGIIKIKI